MSRSAARRFQRERLAAGVVEPQPMPIVERVFGLQNSRTYRKDLTQAYVEDAFLRPHLIHRCKAPQEKPKPAPRAKAEPWKLISL